MNSQLFLLILFIAANLAMSAWAIAADNTNQIRRLPSRNLRVQTNVVVKPTVKPTVPPFQYGPEHQFYVSNKIKVTITSTNTFTASEARRWLQEAIRTLK